MGKYFIGLGLFLALAACSDKSDESGVKPGWTPGLADSLIGCRPAGSETCTCINLEVSLKYTPDEVRNPTVYVSKDLLQIFAKCENKAQGSTQPIMKSEQPGYEFEDPINGCKTGRVRVNTKQELCFALQSRMVNKNCALTQRKALFEQVCPGEFRETE